ncbi:MAG: AbrB/MazE/SpoVT family DNA-binding domain-containing protein [Cytophagales bacterium]|nr:AbrB/MazE/SpoVT family DNA-binding domain-containing protein [Cytophagales bacterium]
MLEIQSKLTSQGQVSIPAAVRSALGVKPGATIRWTVDGQSVSVSREKKYTFEDIHKVLFPNGYAGKPKTDAEIRAARGGGAVARYKRSLA